MRLRPSADHPFLKGCSGLAPAWLRLGLHPTQLPTSMKAPSTPV